MKRTVKITEWIPCVFLWIAACQQSSPRVEIVENGQERPLEILEDDRWIAEAGRLGPDADAVSGDGRLDQKTALPASPGDQLPPVAG